MKYKAKSIEECSTIFEIEVPQETISNAFDEVYKDIAKVANIPGFRAGKAPIDMVRLHYAKDAKEEVLKRLIPDAYRQAVKEHKVDPVSLPQISEVSFDDDKILKFKARVDTRPKFKLKDYKGIAIDKKKTMVKDDEVEKMLNSLRDLNAKYISVEDRAAKDGDYCVSDLECFAGDKPVHKKRESLWLNIDKDTLMSGLTQQMIGMKKGEERDIDVKLPDNYPDKAHAGKMVRYHVLVKEIKERKLPEIDDEFAKGMGRSSLEDLKKEIARELAERAKANAEVEAENALLGKLIDEHKFKVPSTFVARQLEIMVDDAKKRLMEKGFKQEDLDKRNDEFRQKFQDDAQKRVRLLFILDSIALAEKIDSNDEDLKSAYKSIAAQTGKVEDFVKDYYEREGLVDNLREKIRESKTIKFLLDNAKVTEKD